jgi:glutamate formiminotransferase
VNAQTRIFECVPNVSEGRDPNVVEACADAIVRAGAMLVDRTSDAVHHRSVFTFFGTRDRVLAAATALARVTTERIDLRAHAGAHPRIGALDVLPFIPFGSATIDDAVELARAAAARIWETCAVPSVFYGAAATSDARRELADLRVGGFEAIARDGHRGGPPDVGTVAAHPRAGAIAIGVRGPLVAYNVVLATGEVAIARAIARAIRERNGGLRGLRALGIALDETRVQVSCNITDPANVDLGLVFDLVARLAAEHGVHAASSELIGLVPRASLERLAARDFGCDPEAFAPGRRT